MAKFKKKAFKKLGQHNVYTPAYYMLLAKYNLASGYVAEFESNLQVALNSSKGIDKENSQAYGVKLIEAAELHNLNGSYRVAREFLEQARKVLDDNGFMKDAVKGQYSLAMAEALTGQGYYTESIELLREQERYFVGKAVKQETFVDDKGNLKSRKLSEEEMIVRFNDYANLLTQLGNTYGKQGSLKSADSVFVFAAGWIKRSLGESSLAFVRNQFCNANILVENGNENLPKDPDYVKR